MSDIDAAGMSHIGPKRDIAAAFGCGDGIDTTPERVHETGKSEHIGEGQ